MRPQKGLTPAVALIRPKFPHNVGATLRACSYFGARQLWFTGDRVPLEPFEEILPVSEMLNEHRGFISNS